MAKTKKAVDYGRWETMDTDSGLTIVGASQGFAGGGKSHFWLTAPTPTAYFLFEPGGLKGLRTNPQFKDDFDSGAIRVIDYSKELNFGKMARTDRVAKALEVMEQFQLDWDSAMQWAKTVVWDKEDYVWEMIRYAHDEVDSPEPKNFGELNLMYHGWFSDAEANGKNFGLIRGLQDTWGKTGVSARTGKAQQGFTGVYKPRGHKKVEEWVQINMEHSWDDDERVFKTKILEKCRLGVAPELMGTEHDNLNFLGLAMQLAPETEPEEWGF